MLTSLASVLMVRPPRLTIPSVFIFCRSVTRLKRERILAASSRTPNGFVI